MKTKLRFRTAHRFVLRRRNDGCLCPVDLCLDQSKPCALTGRRGANWTKPPLGSTPAVSPGRILRMASPEVTKCFLTGEQPALWCDAKRRPPDAGAGSGQPYGLRMHLTSNQTSPVTIISPVSVSGGMRMNSFTIDAGSGGLNFGNNNTSNVLDILAGVLNGQVFGFTNNSTAPSVINADVRWRMGGAGFHPHIFAGTGDWIVNNHMRSANSSAIGVQKEGPGTMTWSGTNAGPLVNWFDNLGTPVRVNGGTMILKTSDLVDTSAGSPGIVHNGTLLKFDVQPVAGLVTGPATIPGNISGAGPIQITLERSRLRAQAPLAATSSLLAAS